MTHCTRPAVSKRRQGNAASRAAADGAPGDRQARLQTAASRASACTVRRPCVLSSGGARLQARGHHARRRDDATTARPQLAVPSLSRSRLTAPPGFRTRALSCLRVCRLAAMAGMCSSPPPLCAWAILIAPAWARRRCQRGWRHHERLVLGAGELVARAGDVPPGASSLLRRRSEAAITRAPAACGIACRSRRCCTAQSLTFKTCWRAPHHSSSRC